MTNIDEILKLKELLDENIITQEDFEKKKKELLNNDTQNQVEIIKNRDNTDKKDSDTIIEKNTNPKNKWVTLLLCYLFGYLGVHKFYEKKTRMGILYLFTFGLFGVGWVIDLISILLRPNPKHNNKKINFVALIIVLIVFALILSLGYKMSNQTQNIILDINQFYNSDKTNTITQENLISIKGNPNEIENWNYAVNESSSYPITTLYYPNGESYSFYNGNLAWILIEREISYTNKNSILSMFGLKYTKDSQKVADTNYALRYTDCGVSTFWIQGFNKNTFNWVKIVFSDTFK